MSRDIRTQIDNLLSERGYKASANHKKKKYSIRALKGNISMLLVLIVGLTLASGSLFVLYSGYFGKQQGPIQLHGRSSYILFDGSAISTEDFVIAMDVTELFAGDNVNYTHTVEILSDSLVDYDVTFELLNMTDVFTDPEHEHFGFYFDVLVSDVSVLGDTTTVIAGDPATSFVFNYQLDPDFAEPSADLDYELLVTISEVLPPAITANNDDYVVPQDTALDCWVMDNDVCDNAMLITDVTDLPSELTIFIGGPATGDPLGSYVRVYAGPTIPPVGAYCFNYTITDQVTLATSSAMVTINVT